MNEDIQCQLDVNEEPCQLFRHDELLSSSPIKWNKAQNMPSPSRKSVLNTKQSDISIFASGLVGLRQVVPSFPWLMGITGYLSQHSNKNQGARSQQEGHIGEG